jgi:large subunit ribosomal protein L21
MAAESPVVEEAEVIEETVAEDAPKAEAKADNLTKIEGIGPKIAETLAAAGVASYADLAAKTAEEIAEIIKDVRGKHVPDTWPKQAAMAAEGKWDELKAWQDELDGGKPAED